MTQRSLGKAIALVGTLFLLHSAFSTYEHLSYLKAADLDKSSIPLEIVMECVVSALVALIGVVMNAQPFKNILMQEEIKKMTIDRMDTRSSFISFDHRKVPSLKAQKERSL
ncbi:membrane magnesium transporter-domain-containing protein, partial [Gongronella butleri]